MTVKGKNPIGASLVYPSHLTENIDDGSERFKYEPKPICKVCLDDGIVTLLGTVRSGNGPVYERGCAPCRWCQQGYRRAEVWRQASEHPLTDYELSDIEPAVMPVNWKDPAERLRAKQAAIEGKRVHHQVMTHFAERQRELQHGAEVTPASAPAVERPFG